MSGGLMAMGGIFVGAVLAPSHFTALLFMSFFILIGGYVMDEMSMAKWLPARLVGPGMALAGMLMVIWLISNGQF